MARQSKYGPAVEKRILTALRHGATRKLACAAGGIGTSTLAEWLTDKPGFSDAVHKAEAYAAEKALASIIKAAAEGDWRAGAWLLERRFRDDYAPATTLDGNVGLTLRIEWTREWRSVSGPAVEQASQTAQAVAGDTLPRLELPEATGGQGGGQ